MVGLTPGFVNCDSWPHLGHIIEYIYIGQRIVHIYFKINFFIISFQHIWFIYIFLSVLGKLKKFGEKNKWKCLSHYALTHYKTGIHLLDKHILLENREYDLKKIHKSVLENLNQHSDNKEDHVKQGALLK